MEIIEFSMARDPDADGEFRRWRSANPNSFYLNAVGKGWMIHRALCEHVHMDKSANVANSIKICAPTTALLRDWALAKGLPLPTKCQSCKPPMLTPASAD